MIRFLVRVWEKFKAWRRGERMVKGLNRGRCFVKKEDTTGAHRSDAKAEAKLISAKVIRANGTIEHINLEN